MLYWYFFYEIIEVFFVFLYLLFIVKLDNIVYKIYLNFFKIIYFREVNFMFLN